MLWIPSKQKNKWRLLCKWLCGGPCTEIKNGAFVSLCVLWASKRQKNGEEDTQTEIAWKRRKNEVERDVKVQKEDEMQGGMYCMSTELNMPHAKPEGCVYHVQWVLSELPAVCPVLYVCLQHGNEFPLMLRLCICSITQCVVSVNDELPSLHQQLNQRR